MVLGHGLGLSGTPVIAEIFRGTPGEKVSKNVKNHWKNVKKCQFTILSGTTGTAEEKMSKNMVGSVVWLWGEVSW